MARSSENRGTFRLVVLLAALAAGFGGAWFGRVPLANALGRRLAKPATLEKSDLVFVVGGTPELLLPYALGLYRKGYGRELWSVATALTDADEGFERAFGFRFDEESVVERALSRTMPRGRWRVLKGSTDTYTDVRLLKEALERKPVGSVLVVASPVHTGRVDFCVRKLFGPGSKIRFRYAYPSFDDAAGAFPSDDKWVQLIANEAVKTVLYWIKY